MICRACPRQCALDRSKHPGFCRLGSAFKVARVALHEGEEPCLGAHAAAIFFSGCNMRCVFCQNYAISQDLAGLELTGAELYRSFWQLAEEGADFLDLVSPSPYTLDLIPLLRRLKEEHYPLPIVWNSNAYEEVTVLRQLEGLIDIYLPDFKFIRSSSAERYAQTPNYPEYALAAIQEMQRQQTTCRLSNEGRMRAGVLVRHLVLPGLILESKQALIRLNRCFGSKIALSLLRQYEPLGHAAAYPEINRRLRAAEYRSVRELAAGLDFAWILGQDDCSQSEIKTPSFDLSDLQRFLALNH